MRYVDLHLHVSLKTMLGKGLDNRPTCWQNMNVSGVVDLITNGVFDSQSSLTQLARGKCSLAIFTLYPLETKLADANLLQLLARLVDKKFASKRLREIRNHEWTSFQYANDELDHISSMMEHTIDGVPKKLKLLKSWEEYNPVDENSIHALFTIEGSHSLTHGKNQSTDLGEMLKNLLHFRNRCSLFYITMSHLQPMVFANHAFGIKGASKKNFIPDGNGLSDKGKRLIEDCYTLVNGRVVLIDVKHMSLKSRKDFYEFRKEIQKDNIPIMASHIGVTGISREDKSFIRKFAHHHRRGFCKLAYEHVPGIIEDTKFNPASINMYDEDIKEVLLSGGLLGVSFDIRIIGGKPGVVKESISNKEEFVFVSPVGSNIVISNKEEDLIEDDDESAFDDEEVAVVIDGIKHFANQVLHILKVGETIGIDATNHIAIGTDYDGLVAALHEAPDASHLPEFANKLIKVFDQNTNKGVKLGNTTALVEKIMHLNAERFVERWFKNDF